MANRYYFHRSTWSIDTTPPGAPVGVLAACALGTLLGLVLVVFMPVVGFYLVGKALLEIATDGLSSLARLVRRES